MDDTRSSIPCIGNIYLFDPNTKIILINYSIT